MKDDDLMRGLAEALRNEERANGSKSKWEALSQGELGQAELDELEKLAQSDADAATALELFRPLGGAFEEEIAQSFLGAAAGTSVQTTPDVKAAPALRVVHGDGTKKTEARGAKILRLSTLVATPLAVAAAAMLYLGRAHHDDLPLYAMTLASDMQENRGEEHQATAETRLHRHAFFEAVARPAVPPKEPVAARAVLVRNGHASAWKAPIEISPEGSVRIAGPADALFPETRGAYDIVVALGTTSSLPDEATLQKAAERGGETDFRVIRGHVTFLDQ